MEAYIKIYTKMLENPKVGRLDDKTWRIMMELFLLAGETFDDGRLPDVGSIAWKLRRPEKDIVSALQKLAEIGTVTLSDDNASVTNFVKYQNTNQTSYERVKRYRNRLSDNADDNGNDNADETQMKRESVTNDNADDNAVTPLDKDKDIDKELNTVNANALTDARGEKSTAAEKQAFGSLHNVLLTPQEYAKLCEQLPDADSKIEAMSLYFGSHGNAKKYKSHYATALNWARMAKERDGSKPKQTQPVNEYPDFYTKLQAEGAL